MTSDKPQAPQHKQKSINRNLLSCCFSWLPGIPDKNTTDYLPFKYAFFSSLYSGIITTLIFGVTASILFWFFQKNIESYIQKKRELVNTKNQIDINIRKIKVILREPETDLIGPAIDTKSRRSIEIYKLIENEPLEYWLEIFPNDTRLTKLKDLIDKKDDFDIAASNLDILVNQYVRLRNGKAGLIRANDPGYIYYYIGRIRGIDPNTIATFIDFGNLQSFEECFNAIAKDANIKKASENYLKTKTNLSNAISSFEKSLN